MFLHHGAALGSLLKPVSNLEEFTDEEIESRLDSIEQLAGMNLSSRPTLFLDLYCKAVYLLLLDSDGARRETLGNWLQLYSHFLEAKQSLLINESEEETEFRANMAKFKEMEFLARYKEFIANDFP